MKNNTTKYIRNTKWTLDIKTNFDVTSIKHFYRTFIIKQIGFIINLVLLLGFMGNSYAQSSSIKRVKYEDQSLRELAYEYLGNPDYWETILHYNNIASVSELETGMNLEIPVGLVSSTLQKLDEAKNKISDANINGAKILTPDLVAEAENNFNKSLALKKDGNWEEAYDTLQDVLRLASESLKQVLLLRQSSADATVSFTKGNVEKRRPSEKLWNEADLFSKLYEADRTRTLSNSVAEITFIDLSRIRLNENSQALIQHSRVDVLKNITETKVKLIKGDAFAYLLKSPKKKFDIDIPGLDVRIKSKNFWVEKETKATKIANYEGEIELLAKNRKVVVKENQGSVIPDGGLPSEPKDLLPPPILLFPRNMEKVFATKTEIKWEEVRGAEQYWLELATDISFQKIYFSSKNITKNIINIKNLKSGVYYWHVCSIDELGFPGEFSKQNYFIINEDTTKPFLRITSPQNLEGTKSGTLVITGEKESQLELFVNNNPIELIGESNFSFEIKLKDGKNRVVISSVDESGNKTSIVRTVFYEEKKGVENIFTNNFFLTDKNTFITNKREFYLTGKTRPLSNINFYYNEKEVSLIADTNGEYSLKINIFNKETELQQVITTYAGYSGNFKYKIILDEKSPIIKFTNVVPKTSTEKYVVLKGEIIDGDSLFINNEKIDISNNKFEKSISLIEGENVITLVATDVAGNRVVKTLIVVKDTAPPELLNYKLKQDSKKESEYLLVIKASDASGLLKQAVAVIDVDGVEMKIIVRKRNNNTYSKKIFLNSDSKKVELKSIMLKDYLNNSKKYEIK